jgi:DNA repair exonuclease SbcCD ATPase subunit
VREDSVLALIDGFFATRVLGPDRLAYLRSDRAALATTLPAPDDGGKYKEAKRRRSDVEQRIERQLAAIEAGVDPIVVGERIRALKSEREEAEAALAQLAQAQQEEPIDIEEACALLDSLPDLSEPLAEADPKLRHAVYEAFRLRVEIDRNAQQIRLKALVSSAFSQVRSLSDLVAGKAIAGEGFSLMGDAFAVAEFGTKTALALRKRRAM